LFAVVLDYPLDASHVRQEQVRQLARCIAETTTRRHPVVVCGDFNAGPDSDEIRMLTGRSATVAPGLVFYDAWEVAGDGTPGHAWSNRNPLVAVAMYPIGALTTCCPPGRDFGAVGHPTHCELIGIVPPDRLQMSDHYGLLADLRY
jgi:endonuclease/exonuclease/phosphatase family metal-dependent hydrolase